MRFSIGMKWLCSIAALAALACGTVSSVARAQEDGSKEAKYTIKEVMVQGHKDGLLKKILSGDASQEEKQKLLDLYISMFEFEPTKGDMGSWQRLAGGATLAAAKVVVGREDGLKELEKASNCKACHTAHKPN
ncbi:hypothetical protein [Aureliella helgolandensis]|uniref:Cytochrome c n=1 Tax=Aureliella helgolandensis TaxID=2527968 RepID=A0A518GF87_9BACT|nr:hypothetical protein [Aureliella helgolandensis]QDV27262.1 hypothetical protein Q31a_56500 [Aureliella helgolandensis]